MSPSDRGTAARGRRGLFYALALAVFTLGLWWPAGFEFRSDILDTTQRIRLWLPAGYGGGSDRHAVVFLYSGDGGLQVGGLDATLEHIVGPRVAPMIVVFLLLSASAALGAPGEWNGISTRTAPRGSTKKARASSTQ